MVYRYENAKNVAKVGEGDHSLLTVPLARALQRCQLPEHPPAQWPGTIRREDHYA
jgi:hypothetical protein